MRNRLQLQVFILAVVMAAALGQSAAQTSSTSSTIYRLENDSTYETGCFGPCACAVTRAPVRGTFVLTRDGSDPMFTYYKITDVSWTVAQGNPEPRITGTGVYRIGGEFAVEQRLEMDLKVCSNSVQHFDSGPVYGPAPFPAIDITISMNGGQACHDTLIHVDASPVPASQIYPYQLFKGSTFQRGCFPPCLCPIMQKQPVAGTFALVDLVRDPTVTEFGVVDVRWQVGSSSGSPTPTPVRGYGTYRLYGSPPAEHQLSLELTVDGEPETRYDSGRERGGADFPRINSLISINGGRCFDTVIEVNAAPKRTSPRLAPEELNN